MGRLKCTYAHTDAQNAHEPCSWPKFSGKEDMLSQRLQDLLSQRLQEDLLSQRLQEDLLSLMGIHHRILFKFYRELPHVVWIYVASRVGGTVKIPTKRCWTDYWGKFCLHREATLFKLCPEIDLVSMITKSCKGEGGDTSTISLVPLIR